MKKKYLIVILILLVSFGLNFYFFVKYKNGNNYLNTGSGAVIDGKKSNSGTLNKNNIVKKVHVTCEYIIKNSNSNFENTDITKKINSLFLNYKKLKKDFLDSKKLEEYEYEYSVTKAFNEKDCESIKGIDKDNYSYNLCSIYVSKNLSKLDTFKFSNGDTKIEFTQTFKSLYSGTLLEGSNKNIYDSITNFELKKSNVSFDFNNENFLNINYINYFLSNGKESFFKELDKQFLLECKKLNNES